MDVLITGGHGFLGSFLARRLIARGDRVRCLVRKGSDTSRLDGVPVEFVEGDVTDAESVRRAVKGSELVFHLAGIRRSPSQADFQRVNVDATRLLCEAMVELAPKARLVFAGSLAATGPSKETPREDAPFNPAEWYGQSKAEAERIVLSYADRLPVTVARPARILGPGDRENLFFFKLVQKGFVIKVGGAERPLAVVDVEEVVDALMLLAEHPKALGHAFFVAGREVTTLEGLQRDAAKALGINARTVTVPEPVLMGLAQAADVISKLTNKHLPLNRKLARQLLAPGWTCSIQKASELVGYEPRMGIYESVNRSAEWYREKGWL